ncbi:MAG: phospholipase [Muribaculaceae bacterium]|nr:phospholipase [Muribaculaceae bacterium]
MTAAIIILNALIIVGAILYLLHLREQQQNPSQSNEEDQPAEATEQECCGMHITCEKDSLLASLSDEIIYYDDEELDRFAGRGEDQYSDEEIEEFRDVLLTLLPHDIAGWGRSIQLRGITLPSVVRDELLMIVAEARRQASNN